MKKIVKTAAVLLVPLLMLLASCSAAPGSGSSAAQPPSVSVSSGQKAFETAAEQTTTELKAEVSVAGEDKTSAAESKTEISGERSDPNDIYDATGFVSVSDVVPDVILEIRYYSTYNFIGDRVRGYEEPVALLSKEAAYALKDAADILRDKGYRLKIFDAYRPQTAVDHFAEWAEDTDDVRMKQYFYPEIDKSVLFDYGYIARYSGHSRGCTVDLTLFDMETGKEVDMGGSFDYFGELSHPDYSGVTEQQYKNRMILRDAMVSCGFSACGTEWWDFRLIDEPYPDTYFSFPVSLSSLKY